MRSAALAVVEYLLGFLALAFFAFLAFGSGPPTDDQFLFAFKVAAPVAVVELAVLWWRAVPANRLILGAVFSPAGFVAAAGPRRAVVLASLGLLAAVLLALVAATHFRGDVKFAAVFPVIALSWFNRLLRRMVRRRPELEASP